MKFLSLENASGRIIRRMLEAGLAVILAGLAAHYGDNQYYLVLSPVIMGIAKWIREGIATRP